MSDGIKLPLESAKSIEINIQDVVAGVPVAGSYPTSYGYEMFGYRHISFTGQLVTSDATNSFIIEVTDDEDLNTTTGAVWHQIYVYDAINNTNVNSISAASTTTNFALSADYFNWKAFRVTTTIADATAATVIIKARLMV